LTQGKESGIEHMNILTWKLLLCNSQFLRKLHHPIYAAPYYQNPGPPFLFPCIFLACPFFLFKKKIFVKCLEKKTTFDIISLDERKLKKQRLEAIYDLIENGI